jgi:hypothetical protein
MTAAVKEKRYNPAFGSYREAYVHGTAAPKRKAVEAAEAVQQVRAEVQARPVRAYGISFSTVLCLLGTLALVVMLLMNYVNMTSITDRSVRLKEELAQLKEDELVLKAQYQSAIDLKEIERYAIEELGMMVPGANNIVYIDMSGPDKVVISGNGASDENARTDTGETSGNFGLLSAIVEYFK